MFCRKAIGGRWNWFYRVALHVRIASSRPRPLNLLSLHSDRIIQAPAPKSAFAGPCRKNVTTEPDQGYRDSLCGGSKGDDSVRAFWGAPI